MSNWEENIPPTTQSCEEIDNPEKFGEVSTDNCNVVVIIGDAPGGGGSGGLTPGTGLPGVGGGGSGSGGSDYTAPTKEQVAACYAGCDAAHDTMANQICNMAASPYDKQSCYAANEKLRSECYTSCRNTGRMP